ncbi:class I SAM-dependent methyltransferase [Aliikangiella coralliicola]|uniref:Ribosomal RNA small subunit methyltransferase J n=1 Tax=Aliikangiella coralliicola TaxID=2592383 RepID=A0A545UFC9_9GAMM|nr:class I SAM-dependent methyltransferase [Aliikangiella coralliicola]TQV88174.1 hypothetical protein FLL46_06500 [Aliikangiella coralliicola]
MIVEFKVRCHTQSNELVRQKSYDFANQLSLEVVDEFFELNEQQATFEFISDKLCLNLMLDRKSTQLAFDLNDGEVAFRAARANKSNEVVAKAIGCKPHYRPKVLDATAGMGRDALIMAMLGCEVMMHERNFAIFQLLSNALERLKKEAKFSEVAYRLKINQIDSVNKTGELDNVEVIYLDPMFPERKKSALVKKEMRLFKLLAGDDPDADQLLLNALDSSAKRVVVKRPKGAPVLAGKKPSHEIVAKKFRYDVYLNN